MLCARKDEPALHEVVLGGGGVPLPMGDILYKISMKVKFLSHYLVPLSRLSFLALVITTCSHHICSPKGAEGHGGNMPILPWALADARGNGKV